MGLHPVGDPRPLVDSMADGAEGSSGGGGGGVGSHRACAVFSGYGAGIYPGAGLGAAGYGAGKVKTSSRP